ncbi:MAG: hypothetical protein C5B59_04020 [Bacteroidetes bacterium]|nr:MAG: hypothetical protein C5B59_04020 [Bacteroidota bacterium]
MKWIKLLLPAIFLFSLAGCFEINEEINVKSNGSGEMTMRMDMSQLLDMMQQYMGKEELDKQMPKRSMDTTVLMKDLVDTAKNIAEDKKALIRQGKLHMKLNMDEKIFKADMHFPFDNLSNLQKLYTSLNDGSLGAANLFKGLASSRQDSLGGGSPMPDMNQFNSIYDFQSKDGLISRKLNAERWKAIQESQEFAQMKQATSMGIEIPYTITLTLPRPVKKIDNALAKLSDDKKVVTIKYNLIEVIDNPEKFEYTIAY